MFCCIIHVHFLTNVLQNLTKRISAKLLEGGTRHGHTMYPIPASTQCRATIGPPAKCHSNVLDVQSKIGRGEGVGDRLESLGETHSIFVVFFFHVVFCTVWGGGVNCWYSLFH